MKQGELTGQSQELEVVRPDALMAAIAGAAKDPNVDADKMTKLFELYQLMNTEVRKTAFMAALSELQAEVPLIHKGGKNSFTGSTYARREDIHVVLQPLLAKHGFSFSFDEESKNIDKQEATFIATLYHRQGHSEIKRLTVPVDAAAKNRDGKPTRTGIQDMGSTASYAQRYLLKMHLNMAETDEDTDGNSAEKITDDQVKDLEIAIGDQKMDKPRFLVFMGVGDLADILATDLKKAWNAIEVKTRDNNQKASR